MKYIRTKVGKIIAYDDNSKEIDKPMILYYKNDIVKIADTIEELCDEFVLKKIDQPKPFVYTIYFPDLQKYAKDKDWAIYGAIWTSKGLIYVAKMNSKGEMELL